MTRTAARPGSLCPGNFPRERSGGRAALLTTGWPVAENSLLRSLTNIRRRLLGVSITSGVGWGLAAGVVVLVVCAWLDLALDLPPGLRVACSLGAVACGGALIVWAIAAALRQSGRAQL